MSSEEAAAARARLRFMLPPGKVVYTNLIHCSSSGMTRWIDVLVPLVRDDQAYIANITHEVHVATGFGWCKRRNTLKVVGCGMDMGYHVVNGLSDDLYPGGFTCIGKGNARGHRCPSNDHSNGDRNYEPHHHKSGAYALRHAWL